MVPFFRYVAVCGGGFIVALSAQTAFSQFPVHYGGNTQRPVAAQRQAVGAAPVNTGNNRVARPATNGVPRAGLYQYQPGIVGMVPGKTGNPAWDRLSANEKQVFTGGWGLQNPSGGVSSVKDWGQDDRFGPGGQNSTGYSRFQPAWTNQSAPIASQSPGSAHDGMFYGGVPQRAASMSPADTSWGHSGWRNQSGMSSYMSHDGAWSALPLR